MRAQVSLEFMVVFSALFAMFLLVFALSFGGNGNLVQIQDSAASMRNAQSIAAAINYVYLAGDGASYNLSISNVLNTENITVSSHVVSSARRNVYSSAPLLNGKMNFTFLGRGNVILTNNGGEIDAN